VLMESIVVDKEEQSGVTLQKTDDLLADITPSLKMIQKVNKDQKEIYYSTWEEKNGLLPEDEMYDCEQNQTKHDLNADASETEQNLLKTHIIKKQKKINKSQV
jgi:hypothetical protein